MHIKNKRGQSTVEYVLLVTAVVAAIIAFVTEEQWWVSRPAQCDLKYGDRTTLAPWRCN